MITVRKATRDDAAGIASVQVEAWQNAYRGFVDAASLDTMSKPDRAEKFLALLAAPDKFCFVAEDEEGAIAGFVAGGPAHSGGGRYRHEVYSFYVHPSRQKEGIGKLLFLAAARHCKKDGGNNLLLWTLKENPYQAFYVKMGGKRGEDGIFAFGGREYETVAYTWDSLPE